MNIKGLWQHLLTSHQETAPSLGSEHKVCSLCVVHWCMPHEANECYQKQHGSGSRLLHGMNCKDFIVYTMFLVS